MKRVSSFIRHSYICNIGSCNYLQEPIFIVTLGTNILMCGNALEDRAYEELSARGLFCREYR